MMYIITYTLHKPGQDYQALHKAIKEISAVWWHHTTSAWLIQSSLGAQQIFNLLHTHVDSSDDLLVLRLQGEWHGRIHDPDSLKWLRERIF